MACGEFGEGKMTEPKKLLKNKIIFNLNKIKNLKL